MKRVLLSDLSEVPVRTYTDLQIGLSVREDLVATLAQLHTPEDPHADDDDTTPLKKKRKRDEDTRRAQMSALTRQLLVVIESRMTFHRLEDTLVAGASLAQILRGEDDDEQQRHKSGTSSCVGGQ